jgi:GGDEF domain-containing protein
VFSGKKLGDFHPASGRAFRRSPAPEWLALLPALSLGAYWLGGEGMMIVLAIATPVALALVGLSRRMGENFDNTLFHGGFSTEPRLIAGLDEVLTDGPVSGLTTCCFVIMLDDLDTLQDRHGGLARDLVLSRSAERLGLVLRGGDTVARLKGGMFAVSIAPVRRFDLEAGVQLAARLQAVVTAPLAIDDMTLHPSASVGFCMADRAPAPKGASLLNAARAAADEAARNGPGAIRAFLPAMTRRRADRALLRAGVELALDEGQIRPWFQPQLLGFKFQVQRLI